jgi:hypothetical protein
MKLRAPNGFSAMSHGGVDIKPDREGYVEVSPEVAKVLESHGFRPDNVVINTAGLSRPELVKHIQDWHQTKLDAMTTEELSKLLDSVQAPAIEAARQEEPAASEPPPAGFDPATVSDEEIDALNRPELFAYLKLKGVVAAPPITNEKLREIAHRTARGG